MSEVYSQSGTYDIIELSTNDEAIINLAQVKKQLNISHTDDNDLIEILIAAAQKYIQDYLGVFINKQSINYSTQTWPSDAIIWLTRGPYFYGATNIDKPAEGLIVKYATSINNYTILTKDVDYTYAIVDGNVRIQMLSLPSLITDVYNAIIVEHICGWASADIPKPIIQAAIILAAHLYNNRDIVATGTIISSELPYSFRALLDMERNRIFN